MACLSSATEQIRSLPPSQELLTYYKEKMKTYEEDLIKLYNEIQTLKESYHEESKLAAEIAERDELILAHQSTISDLQLCLLQERDLTNRLQMENESLRQREVNYLHSCKSVDCSWKNRINKVELANPTTDGFSYQYNQLLDKIDILEQHLRETTKTSASHVNALLEDRRIQMNEMKMMQKSDRLKIQLLLQKLRRAKELLLKSTEESLQLRKCALLAEQQLMKEKEKKHCNWKEEEVLLSTHATVKETGLKHRPVKSKTSGKGSEKCVCDKFSLLNAKCDKLETRRRLEAQGYRSEIQQLRKEVGQMENQMFKICSILQSFDDAQEFAILDVIQDTSKKSVSIADSLRELKKKIYNIENDFKFL